MQYLVMGANGYVGSYLYECMKADRLNVVGTGHRSVGANELVHFDVLKDSVSGLIGQIKDKERTAIFCIAQPNLEQCWKEEALSRQINVASAKHVIGKLVEQGVHVIYFSTDQVFDGTKGNYTETDETSAISKYGKMKEETERYLLEKYPQVCIFRMPRVVGSKREKQNMLTDLENKAADKKAKCIRGNRISLIAKEDIYQACVMAAERKMAGLYNLSNGEIYSRKELASCFFEMLGAKDIDIIEMDLEKFGFKDARPLNVGLDNSKFKKETRYEFMTYKGMIKKYLIENGCWQ